MTPLTKEELADIRKNRVSGMDIIEIFSAFLAVGNRNAKYNFVESVMNIRTRSDIYTLIETMQEMRNQINASYVKKCNIAAGIGNLLKRALKAMDCGISVFVFYSNDFLHMVIGEEIIKAEVGEFYIVSELFQNAGITLLSADMKISDKKTLMDFIDSFPLNKERNSNFESIFKNIGLVADSTEFTIEINAGY